MWKYLISNTGEVKNKKTGRLVMGSKVNGYRFVTLRINSSLPKLNRLIHRMVAQTFLENKKGKPVVNHKDTNILNNNVSNLEWVTYKENMNTSETKKNLKQGKNSKKILQIQIDNGKIIEEFYGASECEEKTKISSTTILRICNYHAGNKTWGGCTPQKTYRKIYIFIFEDNKNNIDNCLKIAKMRQHQERKHTRSTKTVYQYDKTTKILIQTFQSGSDAARALNIKMVGINQCCQYYKYEDETRPTCYKLKSFKGFIFTQQKLSVN